VGSPDDCYVRRCVKVGVGLLCRERQATECLELVEQRLFVQEKLFRRQNRPFPIAFQELISAAGVFGKALDGLVDVSEGDSDSLSRQIIEKSRRLGEKQGQVTLDPREGNAAANVPIG